MSKICDFCGASKENLFPYRDAIGSNYNICEDCKDKVDSCVCRKCGSIVDPSFMIKGLCTNCIQADIHESSKRKEEARLGVSIEPDDSIIASDIEFSDEDYENWLTMGNTFTPSDMKSSVELRWIWILVKLNAAGVYDNKVILENFPDIEELLDRSFTRLLNNKCRILIGNTPELRQKVRESTVIDYKNQVYILKV